RLIARHGPDEFYRGSIARAIAAEIERAGGVLSLADLEAFQPRVWDRPLEGDYRGYRLLTMPDATGGITLIQMLNLLEGYDLAARVAAGGRSPRAARGVLPPPRRPPRAGRGGGAPPPRPPRRPRREALRGGAPPGPRPPPRARRGPPRRSVAVPRRTEDKGPW